MQVKTIIKEKERDKYLLKIRDEINTNFNLLIRKKSYLDVDIEGRRIFVKVHLKLNVDNLEEMRKKKAEHEE